MVKDTLKDGIGMYDSATGAWHPGADDVIFGTSLMEFNHIYADMTQWPVADVWVDMYAPLINLLPKTAHPGDANNDDHVDVGDLGILAANWGQTGLSWAQADFNGDLTIDVGDLGVLAGNWGWSGQPAAMMIAAPGREVAIPEPLTVLSLLAGMLLAVPRRLRVLGHRHTRVLVLALAFAGILSSSAARADMVPVPNFNFFQDQGANGAALHGDSILSDSSQVPQTGVEYQLGLFKHLNGALICVGNMQNYDLDDWRTTMTGKYTHDLSGTNPATLWPGQRPSSAIMVKDTLKDGIGMYDSATGAWHPGADDVIFGTSLMEFNHIYADMTQWPALISYGDLYAPLINLLPKTAHPGDANNDDHVDVGDLGILAGNWGQTGKSWAQADFNGDLTIDVGDLGVLAGNWGWSGQPAAMMIAAPGREMAIPEPLTILTLALGALTLARRRGTRTV